MTRDLNRATLQARESVRFTAGMAVVMVMVAVTAVAFPGVSTATTGTDPGDWPAYLFSAGHSSHNSGDTAISPANASSLTEVWNWVPPGNGGNKALISSPTVVGGTVFIGANNGTFYALDQSTGMVVWSHPIGKTVATTCGSRGFASTATIADDPVTGLETVYVAAPDGYLYAFDASTGATVWRSLIGLPSATENNYFDWSSPAVAGGDVYVGVSSQCDHPLIQGGVISVDQHTGARLAQYFDVPDGDIGGSVWSSPAVGPSGNVYITSGNGPTTNQFLGTSDSIVALTGSLALLGSWQIPPKGAGPDSDFGGSPTLFSATLPGGSSPTPMVGACNKNGWYYALRRNDLAAGPVWSLHVGAKSSNATGSNECIAAAAYNGRDLFIAGPPTTIGGSNYKGSIREVDPATGAVVWATGLPGDVDGSPTIDGAGTVSVATYDFSGVPNADYLVDASTGAVLSTLSTDNSPEFPQPVFAGANVLLATQSAGLFEYALPSSGGSGSPE